MFDILPSTDPHYGPSFGLRNRALRFFWSGIFFFLFRWSPRPWHSWRVLLLKCFGAKIGKGCHVYPSAVVWAPWNLEMKDYSSMGDGVDCYTMARITLGRRAVVSQKAYLCTGSHDHEDPHFRLFAEPIIVGDEAWICAGSFVGPGVVIGEGCVVGAYSVVVKDTPPWTVCAGNPCRAIKPRRFRK